MLPCALPTLRPPAAAVALAATLLLACGPETLATSPESLLGRWETDAPRYRNSWFEVRPTSLVWGMGSFELDVESIDKIEVVRPDGRPASYRFHYTGSGGEAEVQVLLFEPGPPARLRLGAREEPWYRASGP
jgi:hypothetical protein